MKKHIGHLFVTIAFVLATTLAGTTLPGTAQASVDHSMRILIVADFKAELRIVRNLLRQLNFTNVDEATDGSTALSKLRELHYDLVIVDHELG